MPAPRRFGKGPAGGLEGGRGGLAETGGGEGWTPPPVSVSASAAGRELCRLVGVGEVSVGLAVQLLGGVR